MFGHPAHESLDLSVPSLQVRLIKPVNVVMPQVYEGRPLCPEMPGVNGELEQMLLRIQDLVRFVVNDYASPTVQGVGDA